LDVDARRRCGLAVATTAAGWTHGQRLFEAHLAGDDDEFEPRLLQPEALFKEAVLDALAPRFGLAGPCALLSPACAAASSAIAWATQGVRAGVADVMLAGATDALTEVVYAGFHAMRLLADDACRPFSAGRRGLVLSEGAAFLVLEEASHALRRGATVLARLSGWGLSCDAAGPTTPDAAGILRAMTAALADAGLAAGEIDQVSAHGTGSAANDAAEAEAIARLLGDSLADVPVTAIKGTLGHTEGAAGAFGALAAVLSLRHDALPPLSGYAGRDAALPPLRLVTDGPQEHSGRNVLVNASGFGGANASLLFGKPESSPGIEAPPIRRTVITGSIALTARDGTLVEPSEAICWPRSRSLPLDRISSLVLGGAERLLPRACDGTPDPATAVVLGTTYGSQARHEAIWRALAANGPRGVNPNDFALSTFNAPGSATASACGLGGANLVFLGAASGVAALDEATTQVAAGRAGRVLTGAYEEVTPYFRRVMGGLGEPDVAEAVALLLVEDEAYTQQRGARVMASILGTASRAPSGRWPGAGDFAATMRDALRCAGLEPSDVAAVALDPHRNARDAQLRAVEATFAAGVTLVDLAPLYGNCLAASAPLATHVAIESARRGCWPAETVLRGAATLQPERPVLINAGGMLAGCASMVVVPHGV
ncbi:MAG TPA: beta-ketoacyl synthase N-terminal-like domain-containing protein, partial [Candidatus Limnocylindrales bacterium]